MSFLKIWVLLKQLKRGVIPDKEILNECIKFIEPYARKSEKESIQYNISLSKKEVLTIIDNEGEN
jgi:hypothetical protein